MAQAYTPQRMITRPVSFDWDDLPFYWIPGEPFVSQAQNMNHFLLPAGERWFCRVFQEGLPLVKDPALKKDIALFVKQEANHARAHTEVVDFYAKQGVDVEPIMNWVENWWHENLGPEFRGRPIKSAWLKRRWYLYRLGVVAAIEHFTCVLGKWTLSTAAYKQANAEPRMVDLLSWHAAEEIEHRAVAYSLWQQLGGGTWPERLVCLVSAMAFMAHHMTTAGKFMFAQDKAYQIKSLKEEIRAAQAKDLIPKTGYILKAALRFLKPGFHPSGEASLAEADAYLAQSPAVQAASTHAN